MSAVRFFISVWLQFLFLLSPFFALSMFLSLTRGWSEDRQRQVAVRTTVATVAACLVLFVLGNRVFRVMGITLDSFRVGAGVLLFLSSIRLAQGGSGAPAPLAEGDDPSVVPLAIPVVVGPAVAGTVMVLAAECDRWWQRVVGFGALAWAVVCTGIVLYMAAQLQRRLGREILAVLVKLSGLILAALAAQIIFTGARNLLFQV